MNPLELLEAFRSVDLELDTYNWLIPYSWYFIYVYISLPFVAYILLPFIVGSSGHSGTRSVTIFVLGDIGHSPRMCYHAKSFTNLEYNVNLCGYNESNIAEDLLDNERIDIYPIKPISNPGIPYSIFGPIKALLQALQLFQLLSSFRGTDYIMIQNPPSIPILFIAVLFIKVFSRKTKLIIDWHNLNYSILNLKYNNENHIMVKFLKFYEKFLSKYADLNLTVTENMSKFLVKDFGVDKSKVLVVRDRPGDSFSPLEKLELSKDEISLHQVFKGIDVIDYKILITSTSFTPDEDFNILLDGLKIYDEDKSTKPILLLVTGKGPLKENFIERVEELKFLSKVIIRTAWLEYEDYPLIMSMASLGISLHTSSSGLDLPMKILDYFGCGVPAISLTFPSIGELVNDGSNGLVTDSNTSEEIYRLIKLALSDEKLYTTIKQGAMKESELRWKRNWNEKLSEIFKYRS